MFAEEFAAIKRISIDYAVLEHAKDVVVIEAPFSGDDLGGWSAVACQRGSDAEGNTIVGKHVWIVFKKSAEKNAKAYVPNAAPGRLRRVTGGKA